jgi:AraC family transcriptional regulator, transcriptional activator of pobA
MPEDEFFLSEFKKLLGRKAEENIIDFDSSFIHKFDLQVHRFEDVLRDTNRTVPPNRWSYHRIGLIKKGSGEFITGICKFKAIKNTLVVIPARVITSSKNWTLDMEGYIALFNVDFFLQNNFSNKYIESKKILSSSIQPYIRLTDSEAKEIADIFETILEEKKSESNDKNELIALKIIELLIMSERLFDNKQNLEANIPSIDIIKRFLDLLEANFSTERSVKFYAEKLAVHPNYLNALIKKHTGVTAKESIRNRLLIETKYLLHSTNLSIKEISNQLGFNDPNYFTSFFTKFENISPGNYRASFI